MAVGQVLQLRIKRWIGFLISADYADFGFRFGRCPGLLKPDPATKIYLSDKAEPEPKP